MMTMQAADATRTPQELTEALQDVLDPEYPISVVDLGLIRGVSVEGRAARIKLTYTCMGCPAMEMIQDDVRERLLQVEGIDRVDIEVVWDQWTRRDISQRGLIQLRGVGVI
ncbi:MAG TPA: metal-sulfur cluster assembly factor [Chloroflexota bacterium]|jgi:metal-sulfur cluster biosynthetic enzyme|nr:metal-sulfur cluster assembly factor [Chloroflexota bacterium]